MTTKLAPKLRCPACGRTDHVDVRWLDAERRFLMASCWHCGADIRRVVAPVIDPVRVTGLGRVAVLVNVNVSVTGGILRA